jgi:hypothetical protein
MKIMPIASTKDSYRYKIILPGRARALRLPAATPGVSLEAVFLR